MDWANRLEETERRYNRLSEEMADPAAMKDQSAYQKAAKAASDIS